MLFSSVFTLHYDYPFSCIKNAIAASGSSGGWSTRQSAHESVEASRGGTILDCSTEYWHAVLFLDWLIAPIVTEPPTPAPRSAGLPFRAADLTLNNERFEAD